MLRMVCEVLQLSCERMKTVLYYLTLYDIVLYCIILYDIVLYYIILYCVLSPRLCCPTPLTCTLTCPTSLTPRRGVTTGQPASRQPVTPSITCRTESMTTWKWICSEDLSIKGRCATMWDAYHSSQERKVS